MFASDYTYPIKILKINTIILLKKTDSQFNESERRISKEVRVFLSDRCCVIFCKSRGLDP